MSALGAASPHTAPGITLGMPPRIRAAIAADYPTYQRLFPELATGDRVLEADEFEREVMPTMLVAEPALGYVHYAALKGVTFVRHVATAPEARRQGIARMLLQEVADGARAPESTEWCLNVKPDNAAAIALYEGLGMSRRSMSRALGIRWRTIEDAPVDVVAAASVVAREILSEDDARVTTAMRLMPGQLETARAMGGRTLFMLEAPGIVVGAAIFDPKFPGAYPFRVARPELAPVLLRALQPFKLPAQDMLSVVCEDQPDVAALLESLGAWLKLEAIHMRGPLTGSRSPPSGTGRSARG